MIEEWAQKLADYSVLGFMLYFLATRVITKLDEIQKCLDEIKDEVRRRAK